MTSVKVCYYYVKMTTNMLEVHLFYTPYPAISLGLDLVAFIMPFVDGWNLMHLTDMR